MKHSLIALVCTAALAAPLTAPASGGGGGGGGGGGAGDSEIMNNDPDFIAGMNAVAQKDWAQVVARMGAYTRRNPTDGDAWNELGHAYRLTGRIDPALDAYGKALKINPRHRGAHEYLGEAYLQIGDLARAEQQLKALDRLCFFGCEEYSDLKEQIADYKKTRQPKQAKSGS